MRTSSIHRNKKSKSAISLSRNDKVKIHTPVNFMPEKKIRSIQLNMPEELRTDVLEWADKRMHAGSETSVHAVTEECHFSSTAPPGHKIIHDNKPSEIELICLKRSFTVTDMYMHLNVSICCVEL